MKTIPHPCDRRRRWRTGTVLLLGAALLFAQGCFDFKQEIYLKDDGSGRAMIQYAALSSFLKGGQQFVQFMDPEAKELLLDSDAIRTHLGLMEGLEVERVNVWSKDDVNYARVHLGFQHISQLGDRGITYSWRIEGEHKVLRIIMERERHSGKPGRLQKQIAKGLTDNGFHFTIHLPSKIVDSNAEKVDWSVARWYVPLGYFLDPDAKTRVLYAKVEATTWERVKGWFGDLVPGGS